MERRCGLNELLVYGWVDWLGFCPSSFVLSSLTDRVGWVGGKGFTHLGGEEEEEVAELGKKGKNAEADGLEEDSFGRGVVIEVERHGMEKRGGG